MAQVLNVVKTDDKIKVEFTNAASRELEGPNIFKALEHVSLKARISMNQEKRMVVLLLLPDKMKNRVLSGNNSKTTILLLPDKMKNRVLFNELATFLQAASDIVQR